MSKKETTRVRRNFTPRFERDAVALVQQGKSVTEVARGLGAFSLAAAAIWLVPPKLKDG